MAFRFNQKFYYWQKLGIPCPSPKDQRRLIYDMFTRKKSLHDIKKEEYKMFEGERFYGTFDGGRHVFVIRDDFQLMRSVLIKDFLDHFSKGFFSSFQALETVNRTEEITKKAITGLSGYEWKTVRYIRLYP